MPLPGVHIGSAKQQGNARESDSGGDHHSAGTVPRVVQAPVSSTGDSALRTCSRTTEAVGADVAGASEVAGEERVPTVRRAALASVGGHDLCETCEGIGGTVRAVMRRTVQETRGRPALVIAVERSPMQRSPVCYTPLGAVHCHSRERLVRGASLSDNPALLR